MGRLNFDLNEVSTLTDLANRLGVDVKALYLVSVANEKCKSPDCIFLQVHNNKNYCFMCSQSWFPKLYNRKGEKTHNCRGHGLYGPQFMRAGPDGKSKRVANCCCDHLKCEKIGYSHEGMFNFPKGDSTAHAILALGIKSPTLKQAILATPSNYKIAPWHFHQNHLKRDDGGKWVIKKLPVYKDEEGKSWKFAPPNANLDRFIENIPLPEYCRGGYDDNLPQWFKNQRIIQRRHTEAFIESTPSTSVNHRNQTIAVPRRPSPVVLDCLFSPVDSNTSTNSTPRPRSARTSPETIQINTQDDEIRFLRSQISNQLQLAADKWIKFYC